MVYYGTFEDIYLKSTQRSLIIYICLYQQRIVPIAYGKLSSCLIGNKIFYNNECTHACIIVIF